MSRRFYGYAYAEVPYTIIVFPTNQASVPSEWFRANVLSRMPIVYVFVSGIVENRSWRKKIDSA